MKSYSSDLPNISEVENALKAQLSHVEQHLITTNAEQVDSLKTDLVTINAELNNKLAAIESQMIRHQTVTIISNISIFVLLLITWINLV